MSALFNRILFIIPFVSTFDFNSPTFSPFSSKSCSKFSIFFPSSSLISTFHMKLELTIVSTIIIPKKNANIFLFLYLFIKNGKPHFLLIFTLHPVFLAILVIVLKS